MGKARQTPATQETIHQSVAATVGVAVQTCHLALEGQLLQRHMTLWHKV